MQELNAPETGLQVVSTRFRRYCLVAGCFSASVLFVLALVGSGPGAIGRATPATSAETKHPRDDSSIFQLDIPTKDVSRLMPMSSIQSALRLRDDIRTGRIEVLVVSANTHALVRQLRRDSERGDLVAAVKLEAAAANCISSVYVNADASGLIAGEQMKTACWSAFGEDIKSDRDLEELRIGLVGKFVDVGITDSLVDYCMLARQYLEGHGLFENPTQASSDMQARATRYLLDATSHGGKSAALLLAEAYSTGWLGTKDAKLASNFAELAKKL